MDYLIHAPNYKRTSGGVRALHKLCHCLNQAGCTAYISASGVNPNWNTPKPTQEIANRLAQEGIVIYPEVIRGNPWDAKRVVRYILNRPGLLGGDREYASTETLFCYSGLWRQFVPSDDRILTVPVIETEIFNCTGNEKRSGGVFWVGRRGQHLPRIPETESLVEITYSWPTSGEEIAELFRKATVFYSYSDYTGLISEARLCGCLVVIVGSKNYVWEDYCRGVGGAAGLACWDKDTDVFATNLKRAQDTIDAFPTLYHEYTNKFDAQLQNFIRITQGLA